MLVDAARAAEGSPTVALYWGITMLQKSMPVVQRPNPFIATDIACLWKNTAQSSIGTKRILRVPCVRANPNHCLLVARSSYYTIYV
jgi:hypothetical protein